ncbi:hypothetical protein OBBRIDRAFT_374444 [Obba rivulosa]|uniref:DUF7025 domain-containing protein n=1 Tax=Obba rivulosa TaxID=1052685 RepID=A0A8E2DEH3_9APHY|nr:hypothetical protein OBBRIDRAFT_374444 [Obba rivulosa]
MTGEPRALHVVSASYVKCMFYDITRESIDAIDASDSLSHSLSSDVQKAYGRVQCRIIIPAFKGTKKINALDVFPLKYHSVEAELRKTLLARGKSPWCPPQAVQGDSCAASCSWAVCEAGHIQYQLSYHDRQGYCPVQTVVNCRR